MFRKLSCSLVVFLLGAMLFVTPSVSAETIRVNTTKDVVDEDDGRCSLREAVTAANGDTVAGAIAGECLAGGTADVIRLAEEKTYVLSIDGVEEDSNASGDLDLLSSITIVGGPGTRIRQTVASRVLDVGDAAVVVIDRVTMTGGSGIPEGFDPDGPPGGGIRNKGSLEIRRSLITGNSSSDGRNAFVFRAGNGGAGGGIANFGVLTLHRDVVTKNTTGDGGFARDDLNPGIGGAGGGVYNAPTALLKLAKSKITSNRAGAGGEAASGSPGRGGRGGGIANDGDAEISKSVVSDNLAGVGGKGARGHEGEPGELGGTGGFGARGGAGGGISSRGSMLISATSIAGNTAGTGGRGGEGGAADFCDGGRGGTGGPGGDAGGIADEGDIDLHAVTVSANRTGAGGPGGGGGADFDGQCFAPDGSKGVGGAGGGVVVTSTRTLLARNTTISGNKAAGAGGGIMSAGTVTLRNVTVARNSATVAGGINRTAGDFVLYNTIVGDNIAPSPREDCSGTFIGNSYNLVENISECPGLTGPTDITGIDPRLAALTDNGGPTKTHALKRGSPAIDAGNPTAPGPPPGIAPACEPIDQRGKTRKRCDIGAFER